MRWWGRLSGPRAGKRPSGTLAPPDVAGPLILIDDSAWMWFPDDLDDCPGGCRVTRDWRQLGTASAVVFHIPTVRREILQATPKRLGQRWVAASMESEINYPTLRDPVLMRHFDHTMTYRLDSDFPAPYVDPAIASELRAPARPKTEAALAVYFASNARDRSGRTGYVRELMEYIDVDSYGRCLQNRTLVDDRGRETKLETIARYKFTLAFENSIARDYVTEKFFDPLIAGSVPVYLGGPNVADFAPGEHCYIDVADFAGPRELADYLLALDRDDDAYADYLVWKEREPSESFTTLVERRRVHPLCRLCLALREGR